MAYMLVKVAGANARNPLMNAKATAFNVPSVECDGEMSLSAS